MNDDKPPNEESKRKNIPTPSAILDDESIVELVYQPERRKTYFAQFSAGRWTFLDHIDIGDTHRLAPFSPENNLIKHEALLLPSEPRLYGSEDQLIADIRAFIHRYVDLSPAFEVVATLYVIFTWLYDSFNEVPYLRLRGDFGSGKTRTLQTIGSLCYKAFFASGASTVSPLFHILNSFGGTLIMDEADFRQSDERSEIVKILNNGNVRGVPVLRTMITNQREFNPQAFQVFGPKIVATRRKYDDKGLESRFITEDMGTRRLRPDIPINLPPGFKDEARELRNKLLLYRFHRRLDTRLNEHLVDPKLEPRLNQILVPLLSIVSDPKLRAELRSVALDAQANIVMERGLQVEAQVLEILVELMASTERSVVTIGDLVEALEARYGLEYDHPLSNRWIGNVLRTRLNIRTYKSHGVYAIPLTERAKVQHLCTKYGIGTGYPPPPNADPDANGMVREHV